jgi:hypothetical protein
MFAIVVRLKQGHTQVEFKEDTTNRPDIARLRPAQFYTSAGNISPCNQINRQLFTYPKMNHQIIARFLPKMTSGAR